MADAKPTPGPTVADVIDLATRFSMPPTGWICPRCGAGVAPHITQCPCNTTLGSNVGSVRITYVGGICGCPRFTGSHPRTPDCADSWAV